MTEDRERAEQFLQTRLGWKINSGGLVEYPDGRGGQTVPYPTEAKELWKLAAELEAARCEERTRTATLARQVAEEVGGKFWETHRLNTGLLKFMSRLEKED